MPWPGKFNNGCSVCALSYNKWWLSADFAAGAAKSPSRCRARAPTKRTHNLITDLPLHIPEKVKNLAVRRELVFDECGGAPRRRRQAHAFSNQPNKLLRRKENEAKWQQTEPSQFINIHKNAILIGVFYMTFR